MKAACLLTDSAYILAVSDRGGKGKEGLDSGFIGPEEEESNPKLVSEPLLVGFFQRPLIWRRTSNPAFLQISSIPDLSLMSSAFGGSAALPLAEDLETQ